jgi:hypothetical protein
MNGDDKNEELARLRQEIHAAFMRAATASTWNKSTKGIAHAALHREEYHGLGAGCDTCGGTRSCIYPSIEDQTLIRVPCPDCNGAAT